MLHELPEALALVLIDNGSPDFDWLFDGRPLGLVVADDLRPGVILPRAVHTECLIQVDGQISINEVHEAVCHRVVDL